MIVYKQQQQPSSNSVIINKRINKQLMNENFKAALACNSLVKIKQSSHSNQPNKKNKAFVH